MKKTIRFAFIAVLVAALAAGAVVWKIFGQHPNTGATLQTFPLQGTDIVATIEATGTVEPEEVVDVGAQVAGQIIAFGKDRNGKSIDYGSVVEEGTVLAQIDDSLYAADLAQSSAQLAQARANALSAEANVLQMQARLDQSTRDWERAQKLGPSEALAPTTFDAYKAAYETGKANLAAANAAVEQAKAAILQAEASLKRAQQNVDYCTIKSPVRGVVVDRRVNIGQTVVSSLNAPSLFLIAKDLTRIQVWVWAQKLAMCCGNSCSKRLCSASSGARSASRQDAGVRTSSHCFSIGRPHRRCRPSSRRSRFLPR